MKEKIKHEGLAFLPEKIKLNGVKKTRHNTRRKRKIRPTHSHPKASTISWTKIKKDT